MVTETKADMISIKWTQPRDAEYYRITNYIVRHWEFQNKDKAIEKELSDTADNFQLDDLAPDTLYSIEVGSKNNAGDKFNNPKRHRTLQEEKGKLLCICSTLLYFCLVD